MPLTTALELAILTSWSWLRDYRGRNKTVFIEAAKIVYQSLARYGGGPPSGPNALEQSFVAALMVLKASIMASATSFCFCTTQKHLTVKRAKISRD
jgi:hypothetical protein